MDWCPKRTKGEKGETIYEAVFFREHKWDAVNGLFGGQKDFDPRRYETYEELEVVQQDDGRFSVWGNFAEDTDLLRDTRKDTQGLFAAVAALADEVVVEEG